MYFRLDSKKTPYELWREKKPVVKCFQIFGSDSYILYDRENLESLMQRVTRDNFWDALQLVDLIEYTT